MTLSVAAALTWTAVALAGWALHRFDRWRTATRYDQRRRSLAPFEDFVAAHRGHAPGVVVDWPSGIARCRGCGLSCRSDP